MRFFCALCSTIRDLPVIKVPPSCCGRPMRRAGTPCGDCRESKVHLKREPFRKAVSR